MSDDSDYFSIHDEISQKARQLNAMQFGHKIPEQKSIDKAKEFDLDDIRSALKFILDKLANMDRYIRGSQYRHRGQVIDGESFRQEVIKEFLIGFRDKSSSESDKKLFDEIMMQEPKKLL